MAVTIKQTLLTAIVEQGHLRAEVTTNRNGTREATVTGLSPVIPEQTMTFNSQEELDKFLLQISDSITVLKQVQEFVTQNLTFK